MGSKIAAFLITLIINIAIGVGVFFFMLLAMNGYSESEASYGLVTYVVLALLVSLLMSTGAAFVAHMLLNRKFTSLVSVLIAVPIFSVVGAVLKIVCSIIGVAIAEYVRVNY
jgi:hypothetical protein